MSHLVPEFLRQPSRGLHPMSTTNSSGILGWDAEEAKAATAMQAQVRGSQVRSHIHVRAMDTRQESAWEPSADMESSLQRDRSSPPPSRPSPTPLDPQSPPPAQQSPPIPRSSPPQQPLSDKRSPSPPQQLERHSTSFGEAWSSPPKQLEPLRSLAPPSHQTPQPSTPTRRSAGVGWGVAEQSDLRVQVSHYTVGLGTGSPARVCHLSPNSSALSVSARRPRPRSVRSDRCWRRRATRSTWCCST